VCRSLLGLLYLGPNRLGVSVALALVFRLWIYVFVGNISFRCMSLTSRL
jgi:hypothetical protein